MERVWFSQIEPDDLRQFVPTFPRRIVGFVKVDGRLFAQCADGRAWEVHEHYFAPRPSFAEWAHTMDRRAIADGGA